MMRSDGSVLPSDRFVRKYYNGHKPFVWISYEGGTACADTLLRYLSSVEKSGINPSLFRLERISDDLDMLRTLDFRKSPYSINLVLARLEYNLTRSYLRYVSCQHFGFLNPNNIYNKIDTLSNDSTGLKWKRLCDLRVKRPDSAFCARSLVNVTTDSIGAYISGLLPKGRLYDMLVEHLGTKKLSAGERLKTICNIERCRWRIDVMPDDVSKYVVVNIPSYNLRAVNGDSVIVMRVCCGAKKTKTPLLFGKVMRMDVNPQWIVPKSIAVGYVGRSGYMRSQGMFVYDKKYGKLPPEEASYTKVSQGEQYIIQEGGSKNSLGRIIFRFENNFSVFLHDTSAPWLFQSAYRAISHGCVRVARPYDLAVFMLTDKNKSVAEKIKYTMSVGVGDDTEGKRKADRSRMVNNVKIDPQVPLFITYYTMYYDTDNRIVSYEDVYGFDKVTAERLSPYIK